MRKNRIAIESTSEQRAKNLFSGLLAVYCCIIVFLISITILSSFKTKSDLVHNTLGFPKQFTLESYKILITEENFLRWYCNSILLTVAAIAAVIIISSTTAYGLSRYRFKGVVFLQNLFLLGLMFPIQLGILPIFIMLRRIHLVNNFLGLIILYAANMSFPVFIFSMFFRTLPSTLADAAKIDGAGEFTIFWRVMLPLAKPVIATICLLSTITVWNDFFFPLVFLTKRSMKTVTLGVYQYMSDFLSNWHLVFAAATLSLIPIMILFTLFSSHIVSGITSGSIK
ncbi:MAG: carbohydrate ABC transporter permease [Candidatus Vecturithrix sp.]|jgi:raffinose/stachyose/melibiose transport system permease protein|nr:carbohydrate ABC transporter permease [Candidatus Vecturithrix sp.]